MQDHKIQIVYHKLKRASILKFIKIMKLKF